MEGSVQCSLKQLTYSHESHRLLVWGLRAACRLLQVVVVYTALICASWTVPSFYNRISETTQTLSFTLVDTAASNLHHRSESISASRKVNKVTLAEGKDENLTVSVPVEGSHLPLSQSVGIETGSVDSADGESESKTEQQQATQNYIVRAEPKLITVSTDDKATKVEDKNDKLKLEKNIDEITKANVDEVETKVNSKADGMDASEVAEVLTENAGEGSSNEDIPSFSEWAQKQLAEAEKKKVQNASVLSAGGSVKKLRSKNYASPDCGAKIIAANPEAGSASSVLSPSRDEYMLNTCTIRIWFIVELCEAVQAKKIDLANFELFSSSPKEFTVFVSDRFPSRDWQSVGHFTALDERNVQSFDLHPHLFGKYIKLELHSHYGSEHFCPVSLFRVYGTSEFEVLETEDEVLERVPEVDDEEDDGEEPLDVMESGDVPKNLFGSARDAVLSIVKKAAEALGQSGSPQNLTVSENFKHIVPVKVAGRSEWCCSPSHIVVCDNCSDALFGKVFHLLSCQRHYLHLLIDVSLVHEGIRRSELCADYGLNFVRQKTGVPYLRRPRTNGVDHRRYGRTGFLSAVFPPEYIAALCNVLAIAEKKVVLNVSHETVKVWPLNLTIESNVTNPENTEFQEYLLNTQTMCTAGVEEASQQLELTSSSSLGTATSLIKEKSTDVESIALKIKPTRTLSKNGYQKGEHSDLGSVSLVDSTKVETIRTDEVVQTDSTATVTLSSLFPDNQSVTEPAPEPVGVRTEKIEAVSETQLYPEESDASVDFYSEEPDLSLDTLLSELKDLDMDTSSAASSSVSSSISPPNVVQKESVFLRLSNRIKALERNMSLSGQYLEELSRRYKRQMEEMQRAFDRTLAVIAEESRKGAEREQKQAEMVEALQRQVATLSSAIEMLASEQNSWQHKVFQPSSVLVLMLTAVVIYFTCRSQAHLSDEDSSLVNMKVRKPKRRKSAEGLMGYVANRLGRRRRPSEEALNIIGTYKDLLISESVTTEVGGGKMNLPIMDGKRKKRKKKDSTIKSTCVPEEPKFRRRSDSSSTNPVIVVEGEVLPRRASFSELARSYSSSNERTIVCIKEQEGVEHNVEACNVPDEINYVVVSDQGRITGVCNSANCVDSKRRVDSPGSLAPVNIVVEGGGERTSVINKEAPKMGSSRTVNGTNVQPRRLSSPSYMKTALSARNSRKVSSQSIVEPGQQAKLKSDNWRKLYRSSQLSLPSLPPLLRNGEGQTHTNGNADSKEMHRFSSSVDVHREHSARKGGGGGGLKKMVKRFFE